MDWNHELLASAAWLGKAFFLSLFGSLLIVAALSRWTHWGRQFKRLAWPYFMPSRSIIPLALLTLFAVRLSTLTSNSPLLCCIMLIRKPFAFEGAHVVRNCTSQRCAWSIHGHSYKVEVLLEADALDNGQMVYDFGLMKKHLHSIVDAFDHTLVFWADDNSDYIAACQQHSQRWISLPVSPSAEQLSRVFFILLEQALKAAEMINGEGDVSGVTP